jgi:hypothetical protein
MAKRLTIAALYLISHSAWAIDPATPTISGAGDIVTRRATLISQLWGTTTLPTTLPSVTQNIGNSFPGYNVARVDRYVASMSNGQTNTSDFYLANSPNNNRVVILNPGIRTLATGRPSPPATAYSRCCKRCSLRVTRCSP